MRKQLLIGLAAAALVTLTATLTQAQSAYFQAITNLNPVAYYPLQETVQPPANDVETNLGTLGPVVNAVYPSVFAAKGFASPIVSEPAETSVMFQSGLDGGYLYVPTTDSRYSLPVGPFTVEAWVYPTNYNNFVGIVSQSGANPGGLNGSFVPGGWGLSGQYIATWDSSNIRGFDFHVYNGVCGSPANTSVPRGGAEVAVPFNYALNTWYHLVAVFDGTNASLYIDGTNMTAGAELLAPMPAGTSYVRDTWDPLTIGCSRGVHNNRFGGAIGEVAIYTNALTAAQVQNHYATALNPSPVTPYEQVITNDNAYMYWRLNAPAYTAPDPSTYPAASNHGSLTVQTAYGDSWYGTASSPGAAGPQFPGLLDPSLGNHSYAVAINGAGGANGGTANINIGNAGPAVYVSDAVPIDIGVDSGGVLNITSWANISGFSTTIWFRGNPSDANGNTRFQAIYGHSDNGWRCAMDASGKVHFKPGNNGTEITSARVYNDGGWHQVVTTCTSTTENLYVDGVLDSTATSATTFNGCQQDIILGGDTMYLSSGNENQGGRAAYVLKEGTGVNPNGTNFNNGGYPSRDFAGSIAHFAFFTNVLSAAQVTSLYSAAGAPPVIMSQPFGPRTNGWAYNGTNTYFYFGVVASGSAPLAYQWYRTNSSGSVMLVDDGAKYFGSATVQLVVSNLVDSDSGNYFVVITNNYGAVTSLVSGVSGLIQIYNEPKILSQSPAGGTFSIIAGQTPPTFSVTLTSATNNLAYQWFTNGVPIPPATNTSLPLPAVQLANAGTVLEFVVTNAYGSATSAPVTLNVIPVPTAPTYNYAQQIMALNPAGYWPMHETEPALASRNIETNYGSLGHLADAYYCDWQILAATNVPVILHQQAGALANDPDPGVLFTGNTGSPSGGSGAVIPQTSPLATIKPPFTLEAWVKPNDGVSFQHILSVGSQVASSGLNGGANEGGFDWLYSGSANTFSITTRNGSGIGGTEPKTSANYPPGHWYHLVTTFDGTNMQYYINGVADAMQSTVATMAPNNWMPICIAGGRWSGTLNNPFRGFMDELAVYTNVLQVSDIQAHYNDGISGAAGVYKAAVLADNPLLYYRMDSPPYVTPPVSVAAWFKCNPCDIQQRNWQTLVGHTDQGWRCAMNGGTGAVGFDSGNGNDVRSAGLYNDGNWHLVVGTYDGASNTTVYVDGVLAGRSNKAAVNAIQTSYDVYLASSPNGQSNAFGGRTLAGSMCEAAVFQSCLTSNQALVLYSAAEIKPSWFTQPVSATINQNSGFTNTSLASGSAPIAYQWYQNGIGRPGQTNANLVLTSVQPSDASTNWVVVATNLYGSATSTVWSLTVLSAPTIFQQPPYTNLTLYVGGHATLAVGVGGAVPLHFQWYSNTVALAGATSPTYALTNAQPLFSTNNYYCIVTNSAGSTNSQTVTVNVIALPTLIPFDGVVMGDKPVGFWPLNEPEVGGGDNGVIANDFWGGNDGIYTNVVLAQPGFNPTVDTNGTAAGFGLFTFNSSDVFAIPTNVDFSSPTNSSFSVEVWAKGYQQNVDAGLVSKGYGGGGEQFDLDTGSDGATAANGAANPISHSYRWLLRDAGGTVHTVLSAVNPQDGVWHYLVGVCNETPTNSVMTLYVDGFSVGSTTFAGNSGILASPRSMNIGARPSNASTNIDDFQYAGWLQDVAVFNYALSATQVINHFNAGDIPASVVAISPTNVVAGQYGSASVTATVIGTPPLTLQWFDVGTGLPLAGQTNVTLLFTNVALSQSGDSYYLQAGNPFGTNTGPMANLTVYSGAPTIVTQPAAQLFVQDGAPATLSVSAYGDEPLSYQWQHYNTNTLAWVNLSDNGRIIGSGSNVLSFVSVQDSDAGTYQVVVSNGSGSVPSSSEILLAGTLPISFDVTGLGWMTNGSAVVNNNVLTLTDPNGAGGNGSFYFDYPQYIGGFKASYTYQAGGNRAADGIAFILQNDPRGTTALGGGGGSFGVSGVTPSWELEFNIYAGTADGLGYNVFTNGNNGVNILPGSVSLGSGDPITCNLNYARGIVSMNLTDAVAHTSYSTNINVGDLTKFVNGTTAYVGFSGSYGGSTALQTVSNFSFASLLPETIQVAGANAIVSWPAVPGYVLQQNSDLTTTNWVNVTNPSVVTGGQNQVTVPLGAASTFFRLSLQP